MKWSDYKNLFEDIEQPVKRGRGRPRKNPLPSDIPTTDAPKKRGRPRKVVEPVELKKNKTTVIDGLEVEIEGVFKPTPLWMKARFELFNRKYFDEELPNYSLSKFKIENRNGRLGVTRSKGLVRNGRLLYGNVESIGLSIYYDRNEKTYCSTLLHEMIHAYEVDVLAQIPSHEYNFKKKMNYINSFGNWNVATTETTEEYETRGNINATVQNKILKKYLGVIKYGKNREDYLAFLYPKDKYENFKKFFGKPPYNCETFRILDANYFADYRSVQLNRGSVTGKVLTEDDLNDMLRQGKISDIIRENKEKYEKLGYKLNESVADAIEQSDPFIKVNHSKMIDDDTVFIDMEIE